MAGLQFDADLRNLGPEGYLLRSVVLAGRRAIVVSATTDVGVLYGAFHLLRLLQVQQPIDRLVVAGSPRTRHRVLDHLPAGQDSRSVHLDRPASCPSDLIGLTTKAASCPPRLDA